jgi:dihydrofolate reductase
MAAPSGRVIYYTAASLDGYIADAENSLSWLFVVVPDKPTAERHAEFLSGIGVFVEGSTTYEWVLAEADLLAQPHRWQEFYGERPTFVFTTRELPRVPGADIRFVRGPVTDTLPAIHSAADGQDVWVVGGGDLAGQFLDAGALDEVSVSLAPVTLGGGAPVLPRRLESDRLRLVSATVDGQFVHAVYSVSASARPASARPAS